MRPKRSSVGGDHAVDLGGVGEVGGKHQRLGRADGVADGLEPLGGAGGEREAGALRAEHPRQRAADAGARPGDERDLAGERRLHRLPPVRLAPPRGDRRGRGPQRPPARRSRRADIGWKATATWVSQ